MRHFKVKIGEYSHHTTAEDESEAIRITRLRCGDSKDVPVVVETDEAPETPPEAPPVVDLPGSATGEQTTTTDEGDKTAEKPAAKTRKTRASK